MPLDPSARRFLQAAGAMPQPHEVPISEFRRAVDRLAGAARPEPVSRVQDLTIEGGDQQPLRLRLYVPAAASPLPVVVWLHGGSFVRGGLDTFDAARRSYANASGCLVVAVDQRLSPEARFPAPLLDAYAAVRWAARHARELGGDPHLIGIAGESSGGNLAAAATLLDRASETSVVSFQVLFTPLLDATISMPSATEYGRGHLLTREQLVWCYEQYAPGVPRHDPLLSPLHTPDVEGLPAAVIVTVENDPVRDEGEAYARRLAAAGVPVRHTRIEGMLHHFPGPQAIPLTARLTRDLLASGVAGALGADAGGRN